MNKQLLKMSDADVLSSRKNLSKKPYGGGVDAPFLLSEGEAASISLLIALWMKFKTIVEPLFDGQPRGWGSGHCGE